MCVSVYMYIYIYLRIMTCRAVLNSMLFGLGTVPKTTRGVLISPCAYKRFYNILLPIARSNTEGNVGTGYRPKRLNPKRVYSGPIESTLKYSIIYI